MFVLCGVKIGIYLPRRQDKTPFRFHVIFCSFAQINYLFVPCRLKWKVTFFGRVERIKGEYDCSFVLLFFSSSFLLILTVIVQQTYLIIYSSVQIDTSTLEQA